VDVARTPKRPRKHIGLFGGGVEPVAVRAFLSHVYTFSIPLVSEQRTILLAIPLGAPGHPRRLIPLAEARGLHAALSDKTDKARPYPEFGVGQGKVWLWRMRGGDGADRRPQSLADFGQHACQQVGMLTRANGDADMAGEVGRAEVAKD